MYTPYAGAAGMLLNIYISLSLKQQINQSIIQDILPAISISSFLNISITV
jgi:hypothetical protein